MIGGRDTAGGRARILFALLLLVLTGLIVRTGWFQLIRAEDLQARARRQHYRQIVIPSVRGRILDRDGAPLASCYHSRSIAIDPSVAARISGPTDWVPAWAARFALALGAPDRTGEFMRRIRAAVDRNQRFCYLARWVDRDVAQRVAELKLAGVDIREEARREYPHGAAAAAVIGVVGPGKDGRIAGLTGLERSCDSWLRGKPGRRWVLRSGRREPLHLYPERDIAPKAGRDLVTTLNLGIQQIVEEELDALQELFDPKLSCAIVLDPQTGEILALAGRPGFTPSDFPKINRTALRIPAIHFTFEPGSTIKPLVMAAGLSMGVVQPDQEFDCGPGFRRFGWRTVHDVHPNNTLDAAHVLIKSSNTGIAQVGMAIGVAPLHGYLTSLRFGQPTGLPFHFEEKGDVPALGKWREFEHDVSVSFGRGFTLTPMQLAIAYCTLANGGRVVRPRLLRDRSRPAPEELSLDSASLAFVRDAMLRVVNEGTGRRARVKGLAIGGKTGTSEHYPKGSKKYDSSFAGFAPVDNPRLVVVVVAREPKRSKKYPRPYGGVVAAPVVGRIFRRAIPLLPAPDHAALSESGVRQSVRNSINNERVAAVQRSSVSVGERISLTIGRNPDSESAQECRSER